MAVRWLVKVFGGLQVTNGAEVYQQFPTIRAAKILASVVLSPDGQIEREELASRLWPNEPFGVTNLRLRQELCRLRKALGSASEIISTDVRHVYLERSNVTSDYGFLRYVNSLKPGDDDYQSLVLRAAQQSQEDLLPGWDDDWLDQLRDRARRMQSKCFQTASQGALVSGHEDQHLRFAALADSFSPTPGPRKRLAETPLVADEDPFGEITPRLSQANFAVPQPIDSFFGRSSEINNVLRLLCPEDGPRLVTLAGPGGIGKTRLAVEIGQRLSKSVPTAFISLSEQTAPSQLCKSILTQMGLHTASDTIPITYLANVIPAHGAVIILDNLEQLIPACVDEIISLLSAAGSLKLLITSRIPLKIAGEHVVPVGPLEVSTEAYRMLVDIGQSVRPGLKVTEQSEQDYLKLASWLEGIPLAIRLAGAKLRFMSPADVLSQLKTRLELSSAAPDLAERHRSLGAAVAWSYELIDEEERLALLAICQFPAGCSLPFIQHLVPDIDLYRALDALADASLIHIEDQGDHIRFDVLETVREFSLSTADTEQLAVLSRRFVSCMELFQTEAVPTLLMPINGDLLATLDPEYENIKTAADLALQHNLPERCSLACRLFVYEQSRGRPSLAEARLELLEQDFDQLTPLEQAQLCLAKGFIEFRLRKNADAAANLGKGASIFEEVGDKESATVLRAFQAAAAFNAKQEIPEIESLLAETKAFAESSKNVATKARLYNLLGTLRSWRFEPEAALENYKLADRYCIEAKDSWIQAVNTFAICVCFGVLKKPEGARPYLERAQVSVTGIKDAYQTAMLSGFSSWIEHQCGQFEAAMDGYKQTTEMWRQLDNSYHYCTTLDLHARLCVENGAAEEGLSLCAQSFHSLVDRSEHFPLQRPVMTLAGYLAEQGRVEDAKTLLAKMLRLIHDKGIALSLPENQMLEQVTDVTGPIEKADSAVESSDLIGLFDKFLSEAQVALA